MHSLPSYAIPHRSEVDRLVLVLSDIEMGAGGRVDDFPHSAFLGEMLLRFNEEPYAHIPIDIVFNGDTFDLLKTALDTDDPYPRHITVDVALQKFARIEAAHPRFFRAIQELVNHQVAERHVFFIVGNHDPELLFPAIQKRIHTLCGDKHDHIHFPGWSLDIGKVHIEHGSQHDTMFVMDPKHPFAHFNHHEVLNLPWGAVALLDTVIPLQPLLWFHDRLKPKDQVFDLIPELKELLVSAFWRYWTHDYWRGYFDRSDPTKRLSWTMLKEVLLRFTSHNPDVSIDIALYKQLEHNDKHRVWVIGHQHQAGWRSFGDRKLLQTGCIRDEFMLAQDNLAMRPIPKSYAEIWLHQGEPVRAELREFFGPEPPAECMPESIFDILTHVRTLLSSKGELKKEMAARAAQERADAREARRRGELTPPSTATTIASTPTAVAVPMADAPSGDENGTKRTGS